jgi:hypothetical protein
MGGGDDLHAAIAVQVGCNRWRQHVLVLQEGWVMLQVVVPASAQRPSDPITGHMLALKPGHAWRKLTR